MTAVTQIEAEMKSRRLEGSNKEWSNWSNFEEYYAYAVSSGHAQQYTEMYAQLTGPQQRRARHSTQIFPPLPNPLVGGESGPPHTQRSLETPPTQRLPHRRGRRF